MTDKPAKMRFCWNCGAELGMFTDRQYDRRDTCGARECDREARNQDMEERERAHEELDDRMGW